MTFTDVDPFGAVDPFADTFSAPPAHPFQWPAQATPTRRAALPAPGDIRAMLAEASLETRPVATPAVNLGTGGWSWPVFTIVVGDLILTEVAAEYRGGVAYQVYAVDDGVVDAVLVGFFGLHVDALSEINVWRRRVAGGYTLRQWVEEHPDGVTPQ